MALVVVKCRRFTLHTGLQQRLASSSARNFHLRLYLHYIFIYSGNSELHPVRQLHLHNTDYLELGAIVEREQVVSVDRDCALFALPWLSDLPAGRSGLAVGQPCSVRTATLLLLLGVAVQAFVRRTDGYELAREAQVKLNQRLSNEICTVVDTNKFEVVVSDHFIDGVIGP